MFCTVTLVLPEVHVQCPIWLFIIIIIIIIIIVVCRYSGKHPFLEAVVRHKSLISQEYLLFVTLAKSGT
jgi:hypothetical protein